MTSLESLVPDLATSKRLKAAGFPQDSCFSWFRFVHPEDRTFNEGYSLAHDEYAYNVPVKKVCAAPTAGELAAWLREKRHPTAIRFREFTPGTLECTMTWIEPTSPQPLRELNALGKNDVYALAGVAFQVTA